MTELCKLANKYHTDKYCKHHYTQVYDTYFNSLRYAKMKVLEIGVADCASINMWLDYFPNSYIFGMDLIIPDDLSKNSKFVFIRGNQYNPRDLDNIIKSGKKFDIIIDDGSHVSEHQQYSLSYLWKYLKPGGFYVIEDLNCKRTTHIETTEIVFKEYIKTKSFRSRIIASDESKKISDEIYMCKFHCNNKIIFIRKRVK